MPWFARLGALASIALALTPAAAGAPMRYPPATIVMFVAGWCAPCHAEIARLDEIADAARPFAVAVAVLDDSPAGRAMVRGIAPDRLFRFPPAMRARIEARLYRDSAGLPYSLAIAEDGHACADRHDGLTAARVRTMIATCRAR